MVSGSASASEAVFRKMAAPPRAVDGADSPRRVTMVAATWEASVFSTLDEHGKNTGLYSCGLGSRGELGQGPLIIPRSGACSGPGLSASRHRDCAPVGLHGPRSSGAEPRRRLRLGQRAKRPAWQPGGGRLLAPQDPGRPLCCQDGRLRQRFHVSCGRGYQGEFQILGSDKWSIKSSAPPSLAGWKDIGAGWSNINVLMSDGHVLSWGRDDYAQNTPGGQLQALKIATGSEHAVALLMGGRCSCVGLGRARKLRTNSPGDWQGTTKHNRVVQTHT